MLLFLLVYLLATCQLNPRKSEIFWATKSTVERGTNWMFGMGASWQNWSQKASSLRITPCNQCMWPWPFGCRRIMNQPTSFIQFSNGCKQVRCILTPVVTISARNRLGFFRSDCAKQPEDITVSFLPAVPGAMAQCGWYWYSFSSQIFWCFKELRTWT